MNMLLNALYRGDWITATRVKLLAFFCAPFFVFVLLSDFWTHIQFGTVNSVGEQLGRDFINYWAGARLAIHGRAPLAYDINGFVTFERSLTASNAEFKWFSYPPLAMIIALPFGLLPFVPSFVVWTLAGWALLVRMIAQQMERLTAAVAVLATPAFFMNAFSGQNGAFTATFMASGILLLERHPVLSGVAFGLLSYKPHLGVLIPVALFAGGRWTAFAAAGAMVVAMILASIPVVAWESWIGFARNMPLNREILEIASPNWMRMPTVFSAARLLRMPITVSYIAQLISALLAAISVAVVWRSSAPIELRGSSLIVGTFLATPYAWDYDLVVMLFVLVWYWNYAERCGWKPGEKYALVALVVVPILRLIPYHPWSAECGPIIFWLVLGLLVWRAILHSHDGNCPEQAF
jgi:hypothetical protein